MEGGRQDNAWGFLGLVIFVSFASGCNWEFAIVIEWEQWQVEWNGWLADRNDGWWSRNNGWWMVGSQNDVWQSRSDGWLAELK